MCEQASIVEELRSLESWSSEARSHHGMTPLSYLSHKTGVAIANTSQWQKKESVL